MSESDDELDRIIAWGDAAGVAAEAAADEEAAAADEEAAAADEEAAAADEEAAAADEEAVAEAAADEEAAADVSAPDDPIYDPELEAREYARSLLSAQELKTIAREGFMSLTEVRLLIQHNSTKLSQEMRTETSDIDPELMLHVDARTNYCVFIAGDNVYGREELFERFPFEALNTTPEKVFAQQEVGVFPPDRYATSEDEREYVARDVGSAEEFATVEDLVGHAVDKNHQTRRAPIRIVKTKIFLGKDMWEHFNTTRAFVASIQHFMLPALTGGGAVSFGAAARALPQLLAGTPGAGGRLALEAAERPASRAP